MIAMHHIDNPTPLAFASTRIFRPPFVGLQQRLYVYPAMIRYRHEAQVFPAIIELVPALVMNFLVWWGLHDETMQQQGDPDVSGAVADDIANRGLPPPIFANRAFIFW